MRRLPGGRASERGAAAATRGPAIRSEVARGGAVAPAAWQCRGRTECACEGACRRSAAACRLWAAPAGLGGPAGSGPAAQKGAPALAAVQAPAAADPAVPVPRHARRRHRRRSRHYPAAPCSLAVGARASAAGTAVAEGICPAPPRWALRRRGRCCRSPATPSGRLLDLLEMAVCNLLPPLPPPGQRLQSGPCER
jgi:hypothetical protein